MHTTRDIWFHSGPRLKLSGRLYLPDPSNDLRAGAVFCLGFGGVKEGTPVGLCQARAEAGFTMLSFDYRGFGASEGERALLLPQEQVEDAVAALEYLATQVPGVDPQRIGLDGTSVGGGIAALAAARSPRPRAVVLSVPVRSGSPWMQSVHRWYEFRETRRRGLAAVAHKAATGEVELCERLDIMAPEPQSLVRYAEKTPISMETVWQQQQHEKPYFGYSDSAFWLKVELSNTSSQSIPKLLEITYPLVDDVQVFLISNQQQQQEQRREEQTQRVGPCHPFSVLVAPHRRFVHPPGADATKEMYCMLRSCDC